MRVMCSLLEHLSVQVGEHLFTNFHRQLFCWIDKWFNLSMDDIRHMEDKTKKELDEVTEQSTLHHCLPQGSLFVCTADISGA